MKEAIEFMQDFIQKEYAAYRASYLEREEEVFEEAQAAVNQLYAGELRTTVARGIHPDEEWFAEGEKQLSTVKERLLFQVREYKHPEYGSLWGFYVSYPKGWITKKDGVESSPHWSDSIDCIFYVAKLANRLTGEKRFRIIAEFNCTSGRYQYGSRALEPLGSPVAILQFQSPKDEEGKRIYAEDTELAKQLLNTPRQQTEREKSSPAPAAPVTVRPAGPEQEAFIRTFGPLEEKHLWSGEDYHTCVRILGGRFYTHGFFPEGEDPYRTNLPWQEMKAAMEFLQEVVRILNEGGCTSLGSAGDRRYYPFLCWEEKLAYLPGFASKISESLPGTEYKSYMRTDRSCIFWGKGQEAELKEYLDAKTIKAFKQASKLLKTTLKDRLEFAVVKAPYTVELPAFLGGKFAPGLFAGVFTTRV